METVDCVVVGAGVVGLAVARALALAGRAVLIREAAESIGTETSSRNSEVIHAGIYYPANSLLRDHRGPPFFRAKQSVNHEAPAAGNRTPFTRSIAIRTVTV